MSITLVGRCHARALYIVAGILLWSHKLVWMADAHVAAWHKGDFFSSNMWRLTNLLACIVSTALR